MADEHERKRQRLETPLVMDVDSPAKWDFLSPWCEELRGQLVWVHNGYIRVLGPRSKHEAAVPIDWEKPEEEEEEEMDLETEKVEIWRTKEAIELLTLVATVDKRAFHMLMTQQCQLRLDDEESDEEEEEFRAMGPGQEEADFVFSEGEDSEEEEESDEDAERGDGDEHIDNGDVGEEDEDELDMDVDDDVLVLPPDTLKAERRMERENFVSPRFDFISLQGVLGVKRPESPVPLWEPICLGESPEYEPSEEFKKAKTCILEMQTDAPPRTERLLEIPVSLEISSWAETAEQNAENMKQLDTFMEAVKDRNEKLERIAAEDKAVSSFQNTCVYRIAQLSILVSHQDNITDLLAERLLQVLGRGVLLGELHFYLRDKSKEDVGKVASHAALGKLFSGMLVHPYGPQTKLPSFSKLNIDCGDSALWEFEALCSALSTARAPIEKLCLSDACSYRKRGNTRAQFWKLLAKTFFQSRSCTSGPFSSVRGLDLSKAKLTLDDLAEISAVLREKDHHEAVSKQWDICQKSWLVRENTPLQFTEVVDGRRVLVPGDFAALPFDTAVELVESDLQESNDENEIDTLDVIVPGYGQCRVPRKSVVAVSAKEKPRPPHFKPLESLTISFTTDADGLSGLLKCIGWSLRKLSLSFNREIDVNAMLPAILSSCPSMTKLSLGECFIDLDQFSTVYESGGETFPTILSLYLPDFYSIGDGDGKLFMKSLGDPTTRLGKHLQQLTLHAEEYGEPLEHPTLSELWIALGKNSTLEKVDLIVSNSMWSAIWKRRLRRFNNQLLPPRPLSTSRKLSFLSVTRPIDNKPTGAIQNLDQRVLSLIFEFAATRVVRSVVVH